MDKKVYLRDYENEKYEAVIKDFEKVSTLICEVITGDEVLKIIYESGYIDVIDSDHLSGKLRRNDYRDAQYIIPLNLIDEFTSFEGDWVDRMFHIRKLKKEENRREK